MFINGLCYGLKLYADTNERLTNFVSQLKQTKLETLCIFDVGQKGKIIPQENEHANQIEGEWSLPMSKMKMNQLCFGWILN